MSNTLGLNDFLQIARECLEYLRPFGESSVQVYRHVTFRSRGCSSSFRRRLDPFRLVIDRRDEVLELPNLRKLAATPPEDDDLDQLFGAAAERVWRAVEYYIYLHRTLRYNKPRLERVFELFSEMWRTQYLRVEHALPLLGISRFPRSVDVAKGVRLVPFSERSKEAFWANCSLPDLRPEELISCDSLLVIEEECEAALFQKRDMSAVMGMGERTVQDAMTAIRLALNGSVGAVGVRESYLPSPLSHWFYSPHGPVQPPRELGARLSGEVALSKSSRSSIRENLRWLGIARKNGKLSPMLPALHRFNESFARSSEADALVDLTIALEGTLLFGHDSELKYRLQLRGLRVLDQPTSLDEYLLKSIYDARSKIVHNGLDLGDAISKMKPKKADWPDSSAAFLHAARDLTRRVLKRYLQRAASGENAEDVQKKVDKEIVQRVM